MPDATLPRARAIFPRVETGDLLAAWFAYDAKLEAAPHLSAATELRRDAAANALYDLIFLAATDMTKADVLPPALHSVARA